MIFETILGIWFALGVVAYGLYIGVHERNFADVLGLKWRDIAFGIFVFAMGPIGLLGVATGTTSNDLKFGGLRWKFLPQPPRYYGDDQ